MRNIIVSILFFVVLKCGQAQQISGLLPYCRSVLSEGIGWGSCFPSLFCQAFNNSLNQGNCSSGSCCFINAIEPFKCGNKGQNPTKINPRITGGKLTGSNEFCWQVAIADSEGNFIGGGSLIRPQWILTAAHLVAGMSPDKIIIQIGIPDLSTPDNCTQTINISEIIIHENFDNNTNHYYTNNIALLKLGKLADITSDCVCLACLPNSFDRFEGRMCEASGYGSTFGPGKDISTVIHSVPLLVKNNVDCQEKLRKFLPNFEMHPSYVCAGGDDSREDTCSGDGGGPLVCPDATGKSYVQAGIVSWGLGCGEKNVPSIYTNVVEFIPWIFSKLQDRFLTSLAPNNPNIISFPGLPNIPMPNTQNNPFVAGQFPTELPMKARPTYPGHITTSSTVLFSRSKPVKRPIIFNSANKIDTELESRDISFYDSY